jgi:DNA (cytosine-5)-methyltransferase 1
VFVVGHLGDWRRAAAVLFERHSLSGDTPPRRETREAIAGGAGDGLARCVTAGEGKRGDWETCNVIASLELSNQGSGGNVGWHGPDKPTKTLDTNTPPGVVLGVRLGSAVRRLTPRECERLQGFPDDYTLIPLRKRNKKAEAEELRRFAEGTYQDPDLFKWSADGPRYKALGNSMAVPVMRWIGERIQMVEALQAQARAA